MTAAASARKRNVEAVYPLTPLQQGMLFHTLLEAQEEAYISEVTAGFGADLDPAALRRAWETVVRRHPVLRTAFVWRGRETPLQVVGREVTLPWEERDWRELPEAERRRRHRELLDAERAKLAETTKAPLLRLVLVRGDEGSWSFTWLHHHVILDGWSQAQVMREVSLAYAAHAAGREPELPRVRPFADYVAWLQARDMEEAERFWRREMAGVEGPTPLPPGRGEAADAHLPGRRRRVLPPEATGALTALARAARVTLNSVVQAAWALLLARHSGDGAGRVVFGSTVAGRPPDLAGVEDMVGLFINTLPVVVEVPGDRPLAPWLREQQSRQAERGRFEHTPLVDVHGWSGVPRGTPLFESLYVYESFPTPEGDAAARHEGAAAEASGTATEAADPEAPREVTSLEKTNYPLLLVVAPGDELRLAVIYDRRRFGAADADALLARLEALLTAFTAAPDAPLADFQALSPGELELLLEEWGEAPPAEYGPALAAPPLPARFRAAAACRPERTAVAAGGESLTYAELRRHATGLARRLAAAGVAPGDRVGLCATPGVGMAVGILGIHRAGAAYVALDPAYPGERLAAVVGDALGGGGATPRLVHAGGAARRVVEALPGPKVALAAMDGGAAATGDNALAPAFPENEHLLPLPAYVCYTSGSTGRPKGVVVSHRNLAVSTAARDRFYGAPPETFLLLSSFAFDSSVAGIFWALGSAGTLVLPADDLARDPARIGAEVARRGVTHLLVLPALWELVLAEVPPASLGSLRLVVVAGEACPPALVARHAQLLPGVELCNEYGPTEATVWSSAHRVDPERDADGASVPIGRPVPGYELRVLGRRGEPVPPGVPGELWVGGAGLSAGYHRRPALTAAAFRPDPFAGGGGAGGRLYRTGDRVRWRGDGRLEFLGRVDRQVKLRGHRIEPDEVEAALASHPTVREAAVVLRRDLPGGPRLVAHVAGDGVQAAVEEVRQHLAERLPAHMVPSPIVPIHALPRTLTGKVDRRALLAESVPEGGRTPLNGPVEELLASVWAEVLGIPLPGGEDDFFALGGHSLLATQVVSRLRATLGVEVPLADVFAAPVLAALAARVEERWRRAEGTAAPPLVPVPRDRPIPLSFAQQRLWFLDQLGQAGGAYNVLTPVRLHGELDVAALAAALAALVRRHEALRTHFEVDAESGDPYQVVDEPGPTPLPVIDLARLETGRREGEMRRWLAGEARRPFDLGRGPLVRFALLRLASRLHAVAFTVHHVACDAWSTGVLLRELGALYAARAAGEVAALPRPRLGYPDYAAWQRRWLAGDVLAEEVDWWRRRLAGAPQECTLPPDRPRPRLASHRGANEPFALSEELSRRLKALARSRGVTLYMVLLAGFMTLLGRETGREDVVVGADVANRTRRETEGVVGLFVNQLVLRGDLSGAPSFAELLLRVRDTCLGAYAHQDVPFERLVEELAPARDLGRNPLFQVMFILQNAVRGVATRGGGLELEPIRLPQETTAFDLTVSLAEGGGTVAGTVRYSTDLYDRATVRRAMERFTRVLDRVSTAPDTRLRDLELRHPDEIREEAMEQKERKESKFSKLMNVRRTAVTLSSADLVKESLTSPGQKLPLVYEPATEGVNPVTWAETNRERVDKALAEHGAILFRGFPAIDAIERFEELARAVSPDLMEYGERSSPRSHVKGHAYTSTDHPASEPIVLHNEQSYTLNWPVKIMFYCHVAADEGGRTPLADSRKILARLSPGTVEKFRDRGVLYTRNYNQGLGLTWQEAFGTEERAEVEAHCREAGIEVEWREDGKLRTRQVRPALRTHPKTGEETWFNHALFFNLFSLSDDTREAMLAVVDEDEVPFNTYYGDGTPIETGVLEELRAAFDAETVSFPWREGDVLVVDNMLAAHGREPFSGERKVVVVMAEPIRSLEPAGV